MKKTILLSFLLIYFLVPNDVAVYAASTAGSSAVFDESINLSSAHQQLPDTRVVRLKNFLDRYRSPLSTHAQLIISTADKYDIPWSLVTSICGVESTFCRNLPYNSYNCWGWGNGLIKFKDYTQAIETVSRELNEHYFGRNLDTPEKIGPIYAPPSKTWAHKVRLFMNLIENQTLRDESPLEIMDN